MQFYFIRHAQSENNAMWADTGSEAARSEDPELTELGVHQAEVLAGFLQTGDPLGGNDCGAISGGAMSGGAEHGANGAGPGFDLTHLYSSLMIRSVQTGTIVAKKLGIALHGLEDIHERGGIYLTNPKTGEPEGRPGKDRAYFAQYYPEFVLPDGFVETGWWNNRPHESSDLYRERAKRFLKDLLVKHGGTDDRVAIFSHGGFYNDFLSEVTGIVERKGFSFSIHNTGITRIDFGKDWLSLIYQNRTTHLPPALLT